MYFSWYEKAVDEAEHIYFFRRRVYQGWKGVSPLPSFHGSVEVAYGLKGCADIWINGEIYSLHEGEVCFINSFDRHRYYYSNGTECYIVVISSSFFNKINDLSNISFPVLMEKCDSFYKLKEYLDYIYYQWDKDSLLLKTSFVDMLVWLMKKYYPVIPKKAPDRQNEIPLKAIQYIFEHISENLTLDSMAKKFGYSPNYFSKMLSDFTGTSFREYINACRIIEFNKLRKKEPDIPVSRASEMCGFGSPNSFYRAYKKSQIIK